ncbi:MAG: acyl-CoA/acyl-ACP dehydrogenase [Gammaproteobacteria bacterium]|nr:acyl-CoA/acyl-ACP dehydrogenase [Gammaproteobacteria bacterium]
MNFGFTQEQEMLRDQVRRFMTEACPMSTVRELTAKDAPFSEKLWDQIASLGWLGLIVPEQYGGIGLKWIDLALVLEETARGLSPLPILSQALASAAVLRAGNDEQRANWLPALASGEVRATLALYDEPNWFDAQAVTLTGIPVDDGIELHGRKPFVADAMSSNQLLLAYLGPAGLGLAAIGKSQVKVTEEPSMDVTKPTGSIILDHVQVSADRLMPISPEDLAYLADCGAVAVTAEMVGAADTTLTMTSNYAKERIQFGKPIGQYQGVKHRLADMFVDVESFRSLLYYAAWCIDDAVGELPRAISLAKGYASDAFVRIGIDGVGLHGAIGFTAEYDVQLYLKRSKWSRPMYGDSDYHLDRVATLGGI